MSTKRKILLKVGYHSILLPDDANAAAVVKCLSRGMLVRDCLYANEIRIEKEPHVDVSMSYVPPKARFTDDDGRPLTPEKPARSLPALKPPKYPRLVEDTGRRLL